MSFEAKDGSVDIRFPQKGARVVDEIAGGKIIGAVDHHIIVAEKIECIVGTQGKFVGHHVHVGIEFGNRATGRLHLGLPDGSLAVNDLALEIRFVHPVEVNDTQPTDSGGGEVGKKGRAQSACSDGQNPGGLEFALTLHRHLGHDQVPGIAAHFRRTQVLLGSRVGDSRDQGHLKNVSKKREGVELGCVMGIRRGRGLDLGHLLRTINAL